MLASRTTAPDEPLGWVTQARLAAFVAVALTCWGIHAFLDVRTLISATPDDAFYYFQVADHLSAGNGSTFDGINETNGYHPLWMIVLWALRMAVGWAGDVAFIRIVLICQVALAALTARLIWQVLSRAVSHGAAVAGVIFFTVFQFSPVNGLESALLSFIIAWTIHAAINDPASWRTGLGLAGVLLCRLDFGMVAAGIAAAALWVHRDGPANHRLRDAARLAIPPVTCGVAYLISNRLLFGHWLPVTFDVKTSVDAEFAATTRQLISAYGTRAVLISVTALPALHLLRSIRTRMSRFEAIIGATSVATIVHCAYMILTVSFGPARWHLIPHGPVAALALGLGVQLLVTRMRGAARRPALLGLLAVLIIVSVVSNGRTIRGHYSGATYEPGTGLLELAEFARSELPSESVIALTDAGIVGYLSDRTVINLDGLINSHDTVELLRDGQICESLRHRWNVDYIAALVGSLPRAGYEAHTFRLPAWSRSNQITVLESDEVFRSQANKSAAVALWEFDSAVCRGPV